ncbi:MAG TPA: hypothetical protein VGN42_13350, partial [Pirellulales bacterium]|nr:hypothetical protein [Pirellulales bacterium]
MTTISIPLQEAQARLSELIHALAPGEEVVIMENESPVARLVAPPAPPAARKLGSLRGTVLY